MTVMSTTKRPRDSEEYTSDEIMRIVGAIRNLEGLPKERARTARSLFPEFVERHPVLFESVCQPSFNMERFTYMIRLKREIEGNQRTVEDASKEVGEKLFDIYVKPKL